MKKADSHISLHLDVLVHIFVVLVTLYYMQTPCQKKYSKESLLLVLLVTDADDVLRTVIPSVGYRD